MSGIRIAQVSKEGQNNGNFFLSCLLRNQQAWLDAPVSYRLFFGKDDPIIEMLKQHCIETVVDGKTVFTENPANPLPEAMSLIEGDFFTVKMPAPFYKKHLNSHAPTSTRPAIRPGDYVGTYNNGVLTPTVFTSLRVFAPYYWNDDFETGRKTRCFLNGQAPDQLAEIAFKSYCAPAQASATSASEDTGDFQRGGDDAPIIGYDPKTGAPIY